jgi:hypothetical protein
VLPPSSPRPFRPFLPSPLLPFSPLFPLPSSAGFCLEHVPILSQFFLASLH